MSFTLGKSYGFCAHAPRILKNVKGGRGMKRLLACILSIFLILPGFLLSASALNTGLYIERNPDYLERFSAKDFTETNGTLYTNVSGYLVFSISAFGASFSFQPVIDKGETSCNAFRFVLTNYTASDKMLVTYRYRGSDEELVAETAMEQSNAKQTCLVYMEDVENVASVTVSFYGVRSGSVYLYSINPVSAYKPLQAAYGSLTSCVANSSSGTVTVIGRVSSGMTVRYSGAKLLLYRLPFGQDADRLLADPERETLGEVKISSKFTFVAKAESVSDRLSRYFVTVLTEDGEEFLLTAPTHVTSFSGATEHTETDTGEQYKGICGPGTATVLSLGAESTVVDVYLDKLLVDGNSTYTYMYGGITLQLDRSVVSALDAQIRAYTAAGCSVYLRFLVSSDASNLAFATSDPTEAAYRGIFLQDDLAVVNLFAVSDYLISRYDTGSSYGKICGVILGTGADAPRLYNDCGTLPLELYLKNLADVIFTIRQAILKSNSDARIIIPVTDVISPELIGSVERDGIYDKQLFFAGLAELLSESGYQQYQILLESSHIPYELSENESGSVSPGKQTSGYYTAANAGSFEKLLDRSGICGDGYLFCWTPDPDLSDTELLVSYVYSYHALNRSKGPSLFLLRADSDRLWPLSSVVGNINTAAGSGQDAFVLGIFGANSFQELLNVHPVSGGTTVISLNDGVIKEEAAGTYECWNFSSAIGTLNWNADPNVSSLGIGVADTMGRSLCFTVDFSSDLSGGIYYTFNYPEDMSVYDALSFRFLVDDLDSVRSVFELKVTLYGDGFRAEGSHLISGGEEAEYALDTSLLPGTVRSIRLTVRAVSGSDESCRVYLKEVVACSQTHDSTSLQNLIERTRREARKGVEGSGGLTFSGIMLLVLLAVATAILALSLVRQNKHRTKT